MAVVARLTKRARVVAMAALVTCALPVATAQELLPLSDVLGPVVLTEVVDGDTVVVRSDLGPRTVRLIGIDSPEMNEGTPWLLAREALVRFASPGTPVWVEMGREVEDRYGRLLAYVYVEDPAGRWLVAGFRATQLNLAMVEAGWADTLTIPPNDDYAAMYAAAKALAASRTFGLWGGGPCGCPGRGCGWRGGRCGRCRDGWRLGVSRRSPLALRAGEPRHAQRHRRGVGLCLAGRGPGHDRLLPLGRGLALHVPPAV